MDAMIRLARPPVARRPGAGTSRWISGIFSAVFAFGQARAELPVETRPAFLPTAKEQKVIRQIVEKFMSDYRVPGLSLAMARHGRFVYCEAFGRANEATREAVTPDHLFRIASISKPITAAGILLLMEQGRLRLDSRVFGPGGVLGDDFGPAYPDRVQRITVDDLLRHTVGGWANDRNDPMFRHPRLTASALISRTLAETPLTHEPGTHFAYSNFGYLILGRVIEKLTGESYETWIRHNVLLPCGVTDMRIAGPASVKAPREVHYHSSRDASPYQFNVRRMDAHGGWLGTATDLVQFANHVAGLPSTPSLLKKKSIELMTAPGGVSANYGRGWNVNAEPNWWHGGSLPGTASILVRTADNFCWAALANTRTPGIELALDRMMWRIKHAVRAWR